MAEDTERVLRWTEGGPAATCPTCSKPVDGYDAETETAWELKPEYAGMVGLPVGPEYGRQVPVRTHIHLQPCGHEVERVETTTAPPKTPSV